MNNRQATQDALNILRSGDPFQWYVITLLAVVVYIYTSEIKQKNWKGIAAGLALYSVHWFYEIVNALIQHFSGHALWTVPTGTAFLLLVGVGIELSFMFSIAGLALSRLLPEDPKLNLFRRAEPAAVCHRQCGFLCDRGDLPGPDAHLCMGVSLVGGAAGVYYGIYPLLLRCVLRA